MVTDGFIARQVIDRLYEQLRQVVLNPNAIEMLGNFDPYDVAGAAMDWDTWAINNRNSPTPVFWARPRYLWNSVPSNMAGFILVEVGDEFGAFPGDIPNVVAALDPKP